MGLTRPPSFKLVVAPTFVIRIEVIAWLIESDSVRRGLGDRLINDGGSLQCQRWHDSRLNRGPVRRDGPAPDTMIVSFEFPFRYARALTPRGWDWLDLLELRYRESVG